MSAARSSRSSSPPKRIRRLGFERLEERRVFATYAELVTDLNGTAASSNPGAYTEVSGSLYFTSHESRTAPYQLWKTDGTAAGTKKLYEQSLPIYDLMNFNGSLFFGADNGDLWKSDGTVAGTQEVVVLRRQSSSGIDNLTNVNGTLYFTGLAPTGSRGTPALYKSDGTSAGTAEIEDRLYADYLFNFNGTLIFSAGGVLGKTNGEVGGASVFKEVNNLTNEEFTLVGKNFYFVNGLQLWKSDGTADGTILIEKFQGHDDFHTAILDNVGSEVYFSANDGINGRELWKTDGTVTGTSMVKDIDQGGGGSSPEGLNVNGEFYFQAGQPSTGWELWKSDGTATGTVLVKDIYPGTTDGVTSYLVKGNGKVFFRGDTPQISNRLWVSDGTPEGTRQVFSTRSDLPYDLKNFINHTLITITVGDTLYFTAYSPTTGYELWRTVEINDAPTAVRFDNTVTSIPENTNFPKDYKVADLHVVDDGMGVNNLSLSGPDAAYFTLNGNALFLKAGTNLDYETKAKYQVTVSVDDPTIGKTPDASANITLTVTNVVEPTLMISLNAAGNIEVKDMAGKDDNLTLWRNGPNVVIRDNSSAFDHGFTITNVPGASGSGTTQISIPFATIQATGKPLLISTGNGKDTIQLDFLALYGTAPIPSTGLMLSLGNGDDTLAFVNDATSNVWNLTGPQSGSVIVGQVGTVKFNGVEHIGGGQGADVFKLTNAAAANGILSIDSGLASMLNSLEVVRDASYTLSDTQLIITPNVVGPPPQTFSLANFEQARLTIKHGDALEKYLWTASTKTLKRLP